jgi:hypothetical protein
MRITGAAILALAGQLWAGGFYLQAGNPAASPEARKMNAVLTVKAVGCHDPATAAVTAIAVGWVNGERRAIPLKVAALSEPGAFAIAQQWPQEGKWVIQLSGRNAVAVTTTLVTAGPGGVDWNGGKSEMRVFAAEEVDAMLRR